MNVHRILDNIVFVHIIDFGLLNLRWCQSLGLTIQRLSSLVRLTHRGGLLMLLMLLTLLNQGPIHYSGLLRLLLNSSSWLIDWRNNLGCSGGTVLLAMQKIVYRLELCLLRPLWAGWLLALS